MKNLCKICPLFVAVFVVLSGYGQWSTNEEAVDLELFNTLSVDMVGNQIKLGSICGTNPDNLQPQVFGSSILTNEWSALSSFDSFISGSTNYSYVRNVHFLDEETGFASCSNEGGHSGGDHDQCSIIKTTDGGITWDVKLQAPTQHAFEMIEAIEFFDEDNGIAVGVFDNNGDWFDRSAWVAVTTDGGDSWTEVDLPESMYLKGAFGISIYDESSAYMVLNDMDMDLSNAEKEFYIYKTNNMGLTWQEVHSESLPEDFINDTWEYADHYVSDISFANENVGWLIFRSSYLDSYIYRTEDGGESWNEIDHPIKRSANRQPVNFRDIYIVDEDEIFIAGGNYCTSSEYGDDVSACFRGHTLIYTNDGGVSWDIILYDETDQAAFHEVDYNPETGVGYVVGGGIMSSGGAVYQFQNLSVGLEEELFTTSFSTYPNPTTGDLTIKWSGSEAVHDAILLDSQGRQSMRFDHLINGGLLHLNVAPGFYTFAIMTAEGYSTRKVQVLR